MSAATTSVYYGLASLCLGLVAICVVPLGLPSALSTALGLAVSSEQLGRVELVWLTATLFFSSLFIFNGVLSAAIDLRRGVGSER